VNDETKDGPKSGVAVTLDLQAKVVELQTRLDEVAATLDELGAPRAVEDGDTGSGVVLDLTGRIDCLVKAVEARTAARFAPALGVPRRFVIARVEEVGAGAPGFGQTTAVLALGFDEARAVAKMLYERVYLVPVEEVDRG
jgi:hypothetical protein